MFYRECAVKLFYMKNIFSSCYLISLIVVRDVHGPVGLDFRHFSDRIDMVGFEILQTGPIYGPRPDPPCFELLVWSVGLVGLSNWL